MEIWAVVGPASSSTRTFALLRLGAPGGAVEIASWLSLVHETASFFFSLCFLEEGSIVNISFSRGGERLLHWRAPGSAIQVAKRPSQGYLYYGSLKSCHAE